MFQSLKISSNYHIHTAAVAYDREKEMFQFLSEKGIDMSHLKNITNPKRKAEWMFIREIICQTMPASEDILYNEHRKPRFKNSNFYLSISHSNNRVAIAINEKAETGIDLQFITDKIKRIKPKFLNDLEQDRASDNPIELTCYWTIKEALFKIYGKKDAFLKDNFEVKDFTFNGKNGKALGITRIGSFESIQPMELRKLGNYMMAYSVNY